MTTPVLECRRITKRFDGVAALSEVDFELLPGEVHALCGENGAGKSTLIKAVGGIHPHGSYDGEILVDGRAVAFRSVGDAKIAGIAVIYQELALVDEMTVAENIYLGKEPSRAGFVDWAAVYDGAQRVLARFDIQLDPAARVGSLGVGQRQLVEIAKALAADSRILILDEPTAALSEHETQALLRIVRDLRSRGVSCLYISHRLDEVFAVADRITVFRDGRNIATQPAQGATPAEIIRQMVGREITSLFPRHAPRRGEPLLTVSGLAVARPEDGRVALQDISFEVHAGEVLGIGGLMGAGRSKLLMHLFGVWGRRAAGSTRFLSQTLDGQWNPHRAIRAGLVLVSEDRKRYGLLLEQPVSFNLSLSALDQFASHGFIDRSREFDQAQAMSTALAIRAPSLEALAKSLSGGNQQKVVLGKALMTGPRVVLLDEPTRGIDIGAKTEVYGLINRLSAEGKGVVLVSSELPELLAMSDRIIMLRDGTIGGVFERGAATQEDLLAAAMGHDIGSIAGASTNAAQTGEMP